MKYIAEHYGAALVTFAVLIALAALVVAMLQKDGVIQQQFADALSSFFTKMSGVTGI